MLMLILTVVAAISLLVNLNLAHHNKILRHSHRCAVDQYTELKARSRS